LQNKLKIMFKKNDKILVIAAHPDDEVIGCGGTILKAINEGAIVSVLFLGEGVSTRFPNNEKSKECLKAIKFREKSATNCLKILGIKDYDFNYYLCTKFDTYPIIDFVRLIEKKIKIFKPNIVFTHNDNEVNIDHIIANRATEIACRPLISNTVKSVYTFEAVCSGNFKFDKKFNPNLYIDIKKYFKKKIIALKCYRDEIKSYPFPRSIQGIEIQAKYRGLQSGLEYSEAFKIERKIIKS